MSDPVRRVRRQQVLFQRVDAAGRLRGDEAGQQARATLVEVRPVGLGNSEERLELLGPQTLERPLAQRVKVYERHALLPGDAAHGLRVGQKLLREMSSVLVPGAAVHRGD